MKYTLRKKRNVRRTKKRGGAPLQSTMTKLFGNIKKQKEETQSKNLKKLGKASRELIPRGVKFPNIYAEPIATIKEYKVENNNTIFNPVIRKSTTKKRAKTMKNEFSNFGMFPRTNNELKQIQRQMQYKTQGNYGRMMYNINFNKNNPYMLTNNEKTRLKGIIRNNAKLEY